MVIIGVLIETILKENENIQAIISQKMMTKIVEEIQEKDQEET